MKIKIFTLVLICVCLIYMFGFAFSDGGTIGELIVPSHSVLPNPEADTIPSSPVGSNLPEQIQKVSGVPSVNAKDLHNVYNNDNSSFFGNSSVIERKPFVITDEMLAEWERGTKKSSIQPSLTIADSGTASKSLLTYMPWSSYSTRDQGSAGNCWVWASTAVAEIDHTIDTGIRDILSIGWLVRYYNNAGQCANNGGQMQNFNDFYTGSFGNPSSMKFIPWANSNAEYKDSSQSGCPQAYSGVVTSTPNYPVSSMSFSTLDPYGGAYSNSAAIAWIKAEIDANRACAFVMGWPTAASWSNFVTYWNTNSGTYDPDVRKTAGYTGRSGHVMTIVGYDDVSRYWVVLNSWGTNAVHPSGTFRMDMDMDYMWELNGNRYGNFWTGRHTINWVSTGVTLKDKLGVSRGGKNWYLDYNGNGAWNGPSTDRQYTFGMTGDKSVSGDWWGYGKTHIGVFRPTTHTWYLDKNGNGVWDGSTTDASCTFGLTTDTPVSGKWRTASYTDIGVFRGNKWYLDYNSDMVWSGTTIDRLYTFGLSGDKPVTGDWDNDGLTEIGAFRPSTHTFYLDYNGNGVWNGAPTDRQYTFGLTGDIPVSGDWNNNGFMKIGVFRPTTHTWYLDYNGNGRWDGVPTDKSYSYGLNGDAPVTGNWNGGSTSSISGKVNITRPS